MNYDYALTLVVLVVIVAILVNNGSAKRALDILSKITNKFK